MKYEIYLSKTDTLLNVTLKDAMDYINVPSAAIVIQNDTIIFEHYIGLDSKKYHVAKSFAGLTTNVRDLARIGRLFLNNGNIDGVQILDSSYVQRCFTTHDPGIIGKAKGRYSYSWYWGLLDSYYNGERQHERRYFQTHEELEEYYNTQSVKTPYMTWRTLAGYFAVMHNGGHWAFGLYGQVLYVNPEKNMIGVFLGADRVKDFNILFDQLSVAL